MRISIHGDLKKDNEIDLNELNAVFVVLNLIQTPTLMLRFNLTVDY